MALPGSAGRGLPVPQPARRAALGPTACLKVQLKKEINPCALPLFPPPTPGPSSFSLNLPRLECVRSPGHLHSTDVNPPCQGAPGQGSRHSRGAGRGAGRAGPSKARGL